MMLKLWNKLLLWFDLRINGRIVEIDQLLLIHILHFPSFEMRFLRKCNCRYNNYVFHKCTIILFFEKLANGLWFPVQYSIIQLNIWLPLHGTVEFLPSLFTRYAKLNNFHYLHFSFSDYIHTKDHQIIVLVLFNSNCRHLIGNRCLRTLDEYQCYCIDCFGLAHRSKFAQGLGSITRKAS